MGLPQTFWGLKETYMYGKKEVKLLKKLTAFKRRINLPKWLHHFGPKKYISWEIFQLLILKERYHLSYRRTIEIAELFMKKIPHFTTLQKFAKRISVGMLNMILFFSVKLRKVQVAAIDATGISRQYASEHYKKRIDRLKPIKQAIKLSVLSDCKTNQILSLRTRAKEKSHDTKDVSYLIKKSKVKPELITMDKGYDSEAIHDLCRKQGIYSIIPVRKGCRRGRYRKQMRDCFDKWLYNYRNNGESTFSALKIKYGDSVSSKLFVTQRVQIYCKAINHNLDMIKFNYWRLFLHRQYLRKV